MKKIDGTKIIQKFNPDYLIGRNQKDEIVRTTPTLRLMSGVYGRNACVAWIMIQLNNLNEFCGKRIKMTSEMMDAAANEILDEYPIMTITQFLVFISRFKRGKYGEFFGDIDPLKIMCALQKFKSEASAVMFDYHERMERERLEKEERGKVYVTYEQYLKNKQK